LAATKLLLDASVRGVDDIHIGRMAAAVGARVHYVKIATADAAAVHAGGPAWLLVDEALRGTARGRWSTAHELGHYVLGHDADAIARIHGGGPKLRSDFRYELEADAFAAQALMPDFLFRERCCHERPTLEEVRELGEIFGTSVQATGRRYASFATSACAFVECDGDHIFHAERSETFRGIAVKDRRVEEGALAGRVARGEAGGGGESERVRGVWGQGKLRVEMTEQVEVVPESGVVVAWLWHDAVNPRARRR
jgi:hypothetical protein